MNEVLYSITDTLSILYLVWYVVLFYLSIRKCFLKEGESKGKLFLLTLLTNPITLYFPTVFGIGLLIHQILAAFGVDYYSDAGIVISLSVVSAVYVAVIFLFSRITGKWLHAHNWQLVTFVLLMFGVIFVLSERSSLANADNSLVFNIVDLSGYVVLLIASILLYRFVIRALAELTDRRRAITPSLFTVPPTVFILLYSVFAIIAVMRSIRGLANR